MTRHGGCVVGSGAVEARMGEPARHKRHLPLLRRCRTSFALRASTCAHTVAVKNNYGNEASVRWKALMNGAELGSDLEARVGQGDRGANARKI